MKKILCIVAVVALFSFTGCKRTCQCTATQTFASGEIDPMVTTYETVEKSKCEELNTTATTSMAGETLTQVVECVEK